MWGRGLSAPHGVEHKVGERGVAYLSVGLYEGTGVGLPGSLGRGLSFLEAISMKLGL